MPMRHVLATAVTGIALLVGCSTGPQAATTDFSVMDSAGDTVSLSAYEGQVLIVDVWAVW